jgi:2-keto-3-deoxy-L-rhamnonate aldolase RhmA
MRQLLLSRDSVAHGTFIKTDSPQLIEVLGTTGLDFAVLDAEHAPFDRVTLDRMLLAGQAADLPLLVRVPDSGAATILSVLDMGAAGILVPQVDSADQARLVVSRAKYRGGSRGFSISPRAARYGASPRADVISQGDATRVLCQIESVSSLEQVDAIAAVAGVDALFIGRADLALSMGLDDPRAPEVAAAVVRIAAAARLAGKVCAMHVANAEEARRFAELGITWFVISSDQGLLQKAGRSIARDVARKDDRGMP